MADLTEVQAGQVVNIADESGNEAIVSAAGALSVDGSGVTQPVSGTITANLGTTNGGAGQLALDATLTSGTQKTKIVDTGGTNVASVSAAGAVKVDGSGVTQPISAASLPLPTGASTSANQSTANTSLSSIDGKLASLGQKTMAGSEPIVIASDQSPLLPPSDLSASGTITALNGSVADVVHGVNSAIVTLSGVWVASIQFQGMTPDGSWSNLTSALLPSGGLFSSAVVTVNGSYRLVSAAGYSQIRATATAFTSGTVSVAINVASGQYIVQPVQITAANLNAQVVGSTADAASWTGNPVNVGGKDSLGLVRTIQTDSGGRQVVTQIASYMTGLGTTFSLSSEGTNAPTGSADNPILLLKNPNASGKTMYVHRILAGTSVTNRSLVFEVYGSPTITANGSATTIVNNLIGNGTTSVGTAFTTPSISANGNLIIGLANGQNSNAIIAPIDFTIQIPPNNNLLIIANPSANNTTVEITVVWSEF